MSDLISPLIVAEQLVKAYELGGSLIAALQGISVEVARGEYLAVTGPRVRGNPPS
jgi:ABC-type lipoprotein export system ATPase subunit